MKTYGQYCGLAKALDFVGERWTLLIVRNLLLGPARYGELQRGLPGITTNLLAKRLKDMAAHGIIEKTAANGGSYQLTDRGWSLEPAVHALANWGAHAMDKIGPDDAVNFEWFLASLRRRYLNGPGGLHLRCEVTADNVPYRIELRGQTLAVERGSMRDPDLRLKGSEMPLMRYLSRTDEPARLPRGLELTSGGPDELNTLVQAFGYRQD